IFSLCFRLPTASSHFSHFSHLSLLYSIFFSFNLQKNYEQKSKPRCLPFQAVAVVVDQVPLCLSLAGAASADCFFSSRRRGSKPSPPSLCCLLPPFQIHCKQRHRRRSRGVFRRCSLSPASAVIRSWICLRLSCRRRTAARPPPPLLPGRQNKNKVI
ncbi:hypothetical protein LINPERHAP1_LOCUS8196, partial [Linum perenne]